MSFIKLKLSDTGFLFTILGIGFGIATNSSKKDTSVTFTFKFFKFHTFISFAII